MISWVCRVHFKCNFAKGHGTPSIKLKNNNNNNGDLGGLTSPIGWSNISIQNDDFGLLTSAVGWSSLINNRLLLEKSDSF